jgi:hypothetical protein
MASRLPSGLIEAKIFLAYKKDLSNLNLQEARLRRQREKDEARLKEVQALRRQQEAAAQPRLDQDAKLYIQAVHEGKSEEWEPERAIASPEGMSLGFEFTIEQIEMRALQIEPDLFHEWALSHRKRQTGRKPAELPRASMPLELGRYPARDRMAHTKTDTKKEFEWDRPEQTARLTRRK